MNPGKKSINPFLETILRSSSEIDPSRTAEQKTSLRLISLISQKRSAPVPELLEASEMTVADFAQALSACQSAGLVEVKGSGAKQVVELTDMGNKLASII